MQKETIKAAKIDVLQSVVDEIAYIGVLTQCYEKLEVSKTIYSLLQSYPHTRSITPEHISDIHICLAKSYLEIAILTNNELTDSLCKAIINIECALSELVDSLETSETKTIQ